MSLKLCEIKSIDKKKMENELFFYLCYGGEIVKFNGSIEYRGGRVITKIMNVHIPYIEFVSIVCDRLKVESTALKMYYTCKFDQSMLLLLEDDA